MFTKYSLSVPLQLHASGVDCSWPMVADMALAITQGHATQTGDAELASVLAELEAMSSEQVRKSVADQDGRRASSFT